MRTAVLFEPEELLFDTLMLRANALQTALEAEGFSADLSAIRHLHAGVPSLVALTSIAMHSRIDTTAFELVLRRASDAFRSAIGASPPSFDPEAASAVVRLASEFPLGVVTRGEREDTQRLLAQAGLDQCVSVIRSLGATAVSLHHTVWDDARTTLRAARGIALVPAGLRDGARGAGLATPYSTGHASLHALATADAGFVDSLF